MKRYSTCALPPYRYMPGRFPHPTRDPAGHSYGKPETRLSSFDADAWHRTAPYLYGVDLFNLRYWWEAHEALESCWVGAGRTTPTGLFLQGLIQVAVACLKKEQAFEDVARRLSTEGLEKINLQPGIFLGVDTGTLTIATNEYIHGESDMPPRIILHFPDR